MSDTALEIVKSGGEIATRGERYVAALTQVAPFGESISRHHRPFYDDYSIAQAHILQAVGNLDDIDIFGRQVLCAVFCRPGVTPGGVYLSVKEVREDHWQHKVVMILKKGPEAFHGKQSYLDMTFGVDATSPGPGDWMIANASAGIQINLAGDGGSRPQGKDHMGRAMDLFEWDGWPCRIIGDDNFLGRLRTGGGMGAHSVV